MFVKENIKKIELLFIELVIIDLTKFMAIQLDNFINELALIEFRNLVANQSTDGWCYIYNTVFFRFSRLTVFSFIQFAIFFVNLERDRRINRLVTRYY